MHDSTCQPPSHLMSLRQGFRKREAGKIAVHLPFARSRMRPITWGCSSLNSGVPMHSPSMTMIDIYIHKQTYRKVSLSSSCDNTLRIILIVVLGLYMCLVETMHQKLYSCNIFSLILCQTNVRKYIKRCWTRTYEGDG